MKKNLFFILIFIFECIDINAGIFIKTDDGYILKESKFEGISIKEACESLGFDSNMYYLYFGSKTNSDIFSVCFKIFTTDIICVFTNDNVLDLRDQDVDSFLSDFKFSSQYSTHNMESDLSEGIQNKNLSIEFLSDIFKIPYNKNSIDTMLVCDRFKYNLYFKNGFLCEFNPSDGYNNSARYFMKQNPSYFNKMELLAKEYWGKDTENIKKELNIQCEALYNLPQGLRNEYLDRFLLKYGCYNFKIVFVLYYDDKLTLREFKDICHSKQEFISKEEIDGDNIYIYGYKGALFAFDESGNLLLVNP